MSRVDEAVKQGSDALEGSSAEDCSNRARNREQNCSSDPALARIVKAWPTLPEAVRRGIVAMVEAARSGD
jgi:hypothetical protein